MASTDIKTVHTIIKSELVMAYLNNCSDLHLSYKHFNKYE